MKVKFQHVVLAFTAALLAGCGGGGSSSGDSAAAAPAAPASAVGAAPSNAVVQSTTPNVQPIYVAETATGTRNLLQTSVTLCVPGTATCQTIDDIQVDTGSQGLRVLASALSPALALAPVAAPDGSSSGVCAVFGTGYTWGSVRSADIRLAGQLASSTSIQVIADPAIAGPSSDCSQSGSPMQNATTLRGNGILGVGPFIADCGSSCANSPLPRWYYACSTSACTERAMPLAQQVTNPVSRFATDNNGVLIELPAVPDAGSATVAGTMTFGIGSQANNLLGNATVLPTNPTTGYVTTDFAGVSFATSFIDSGTNAIFFPTTPADVPACGIWYCPPTPLTLPATIRSPNGAASAASVAIASATELLGTSNYALPNLAGQVKDLFAWGLPFFYGKRVFTAFENRPTPAGAGPYYAF